MKRPLLYSVPVIAFFIMLAIYPRPKLVFSSRPAFPESVRIEDVTFHLRYSPYPCGHDNLLGCTWGRSKPEIEILTGMTLDEERETVIHELTHAAIDVHRATDYDQKDLSTEDAFIGKIEGPFVSLLADNPDLIAYFK